MNPYDEDFLSHYGVKGMKWGVRRKAVGKINSSMARRRKLRKLNPDYSIKDRQVDTIMHGPAFVKAVNKNMNKGMQYKAAHKKVIRNRLKIGAALVAAYFAANIVANGPAIRYNSQILLNDAVGKKQAKNGAKAARNLLADSKGIANYKVIQGEVLSNLTS